MSTLKRLHCRLHCFMADFHAKGGVNFLLYVLNIWVPN